MSNSERMELLDMLAEVFEDFLDSKNIVIENDEKTGIDTAANIYGTDYFNITSRLGSILEDWKLIPTEAEVLS